MGSSDHVLTVYQHALCEAMRTGLLVFGKQARFMTRTEKDSVLTRMEVRAGVPCPVPVVLDVSERVAKEAEWKGALGLRDREGVLVGTVRVADVWKHDRKKSDAIALCGTKAWESGRRHAGIDHILAMNEWLVGGDVVFQSGVQASSRSPIRTAAAPTTISFQTRRPMLAGIARILADMMARENAGALVQVLTGPSVVRGGEVDPGVVWRTWGQTMIAREPSLLHRSRLVRSMALPFAKTCCGPREALLGCIIARNSGCSHVLVGPEAEHVGREPEVDFEETKKLLKEHARDYGVEPLFVDPFASTRSTVFDSATFDKLRAGVFEGIECSTDVRQVLCARYPPKSKQGFCVLFTGLSGSGKSTIARALSDKITAEDLTGRRITVLDGDLVRHHLSKGLGFSRQDRETNVLRIGFVASLIGSSGGIALCAPIAPHADIRRQVRKMCQDADCGFIEVHVSTPLSECERRDVKGLYAKARSGVLKNFTGIDDPYEEPESPEIRIDTTGQSISESVGKIWTHLRDSGYF
jgi:sulfate adenylyltransferase